MRCLTHILSVALAGMVLAAGLLAVPMACESIDSTCKMGCGMEMSSSSCCCNVDQQNSASQPVKTALSVPTVLPKFSPPSGVFAYAVFQTNSTPGFALHRAANLSLERGGLAFLGIFLI